MQQNILGVKMIDQTEVGKLIGTKSRSTISEWLARAGLEGISIRNRKWYAEDLIRDFLRYERVETRQAIELLREIKIMVLKKREVPQTQVSQVQKERIWTR